MATETKRDCGAVQRPASPVAGTTQTARDAGAVERENTAGGGDSVASTYYYQTLLQGVGR